MKILIIGDGKVGHTLADLLSRENHDVTIVDNNAEALRKAVSKLDVLCVEGSGSSIATLREAEADKADLVIAVTSRDEVNMVSSFFAKKLGAKYIVARIRNPEFNAVSSGDSTEWMQGLGIDMVINPELTTASEISRLLRFPEARSIEQFARGQVELVELVMQADMRVLDIPMSELTPQLPTKVLFCAVERDGSVLIPDGEMVLREGDRVHVAGEPRQLTQFVRYLGMATQKIRKVMVVGGSRIAYYLCRQLNGIGMNTRIIEIDEQRCAELDDMLPDTQLILGDGTDQDMLDEERLAEMDVFVALTDRDEENLVVSMHAKQMGVKKVIAKVTRASYANLVDAMGLDTTISPKDLTANRIMRYVRAVENSQGSFVETLYRLLGGRLEALEFTVIRSSRLIGKPLKELPLRKGILVAAIVHNQRTIIPFGDDVIREGDRVIIVTNGGPYKELNQILQ